MPDAEAMGSLLVVGDDAVAWSTAVTLVKELGRYGVSVSVLASPNANPSPLVEISRPALHELIGIWGFDERQLMLSTSSLFSLGAHYQVPGRPDFFLPLSDHGIGPAPASFEQGFLKAYSPEHYTAYNQHFLATQAAVRNRFDFPSQDPRSVKSTLRYGFHLDMAQYEVYLRSQAQALGVRIIDAGVAGVDLAPETGHIDSLRLSNGEHLEADFFLDCTGVTAELIEKALGVSYISWSDGLPWDRQLSACDSDAEQAKPFSQLRAENHGWYRAADLQGRKVEEYFYSHAHDSDSATYKRLVAQDSATKRHLKPGRRERFWAANCLALGDAAGSATPLVISELHWACTALLLWLELYPNGHNMEGQRREYNRRCGEVLGGIRDFHLAHLAYTELQGRQPSIRVGAEVDLAGGAALAEELPEKRPEKLPESLQWKLSLFVDQGRLWVNEEEPVSRDHWIALLLGLGMTPARQDIVLASVPNEQLINTHRKILKKLIDTAEQMPLLEEVVERYCPARNTKL